MPIHAPKIVFFGGDLTPKWGAVSMQPPNAHPCIETRRIMYRSLKSVHWCDLCDYKTKKKGEEAKLWQTGYLPRSPLSSHWDSVLHGGWHFGASS